MNRTDYLAIATHLVVIVAANLIWWLWLFPIYIRWAVQS